MFFAWKLSCERVNVKCLMGRKLKMALVGALSRTFWSICLASEVSILAVSSNCLILNYMGWYWKALDSVLRVWPFLKALSFLIGIPKFYPPSLLAEPTPNLKVPVMRICGPGNILEDQTSGPTPYLISATSVLGDVSLNFPEDKNHPGQKY